MRVTECSCPLPATPMVCPACGMSGRAVDAATVRALLMPEALPRLEHTQFHFCAAPSCPVVYYSCAGATFRTTDLHVPVWQKNAPGARIVCYCFGENEADIRREIEDTGRTGAIDRVRVHMAERHCACAVRNPRGVCCLGDLVVAAKAVDRWVRVRT